MGSCSCDSARPVCSMARGSATSYRGARHFHFRSCRTRNTSARCCRSGAYSRSRVFRTETGICCRFSRRRTTRSGPDSSSNSFTGALRLLPNHRAAATTSSPPGPKVVFTGLGLCPFSPSPAPAGDPVRRQRQVWPGLRAARRTGGRMKLDTHVHTVYSGHSTIKPLRRLMRESYNQVERVYQRARQRGMDLVAITDHDTIDGVLTIADRPDVIVGCEVTGVFPADDVRVHLGVLGITEAQFREIARLRGNVFELLPYLRAERVFTSVNHVASRINGHITAAHIAALLPWVDALEIRNGSRLPSQNRTAAALAAAHRKVGVAGSD